MLLQSSMLATRSGRAFLCPISIFPSAGVYQGEVAGKSRYAGRSFAFGDGSFPEVTAL